MSPRYLTLAFCAALCACTGAVDHPLGPAASVRPGDSQGGGGDPVIDGVRTPLCDAAASDDRPGPRLMRRLTKLEFERSVRSIFGLDDSFASSLPPDSAAQSGFTNQADQLTVSASFAERLMETAAALGDRVAEPTMLAQLLPCSTQAADTACAVSYLQSVGRRLYRRRLSPQEQARFLELHATITGQGGTFQSWAKWATIGLVTSPHAVYRSEIGEAAASGRYSLTPAERATALAFTFTGGPPDTALLDAAEAGMLEDPEGLKAAVRSLVFDDKQAIRPSFRAQFLRFANQWLGLSALENRQKDLATFPDWNDEIRASMRHEVEAFLEHVLLEQQGGMEELLTAPYTLLDAKLTKFYGYGNASSSEMVVTDRPPAWGVGLLAQGAILALKSTHRDTSPTQRGHFVRDRVLCFDVPPPPPAVGQIPEPTGNETTRQRYEEVHAASPACASCHQLMDPIGFGFEHLDATGRFRATEGGLPIDASGRIAPAQSGEADIPFDDMTELAHELAQRDSAGACFGAYFASFAFGLDRHDSRCLVQSSRSELGQGKLSVLDFMLQLVTAPHFTTRVDG